MLVRLGQDSAVRVVMAAIQRLEAGTVGREEPADLPQRREDGTWTGMRHRPHCRIGGT